MRPTLALITAVAALTSGCTPETRRVNPGAQTAWLEANAAAMEPFVPLADKVHTSGMHFIEKWMLGYCLGDESAIYVWTKAPEYVPEHEFCHLIDCEKGDWIKARARLGVGIPESIDRFCVSLSHSKRFPGYQWQALQDAYPGLPVIEHAEIIERLRNNAH